MEPTQELQTIKVPLKERISYFFSDFGHQGVMWNFVNTYILFFFTDILGITPAAAGVLLLVVTIFDAVNDPLIGWLCDRTRTKWGTYRPYVIASAIPMGLLTFLCFVAPNFTGGGKLAYAYVVYTLFTVVGTFAGCGFGALPAVMTNDPQERVILGTFRDFGANFGGFLLNLVVVSLITFFSKDTIPTAGGLRMVAFLVGCWVCVCLLICGFGCKERIAPADAPANFLQAFKSIFSNKPAICLILMVICINGFLVFKATLTSYYCINYLENFELMSPIMTLMFTTPLIGLFFVPKVVSLLGKKGMFIMSGIFAILSGLLLLIAQKNIIMICIASLCCGLVVTGVFATVWGTMPDAADYGEWKTGVYCPGVITALAVFGSKLGSAIMQYGASLVLTLTGYNSDLEIQSVQTVNALYWSTGIIPIVMGIIAILCILPYDLTDEKMKEINLELAQRRAKVEQ